jgi:hypothetical protein
VELPLRRKTQVLRPKEGALAADEVFQSATETSTITTRKILTTEAMENPSARSERHPPNLPNARFLDMGPVQAVSMY